jgi:hypothetical protein
MSIVLAADQPNPSGTPMAEPHRGAMKFMTDPASIARVRELILKQPNLNVLQDEHKGKYSASVEAIEREIKSRDGTGKLLLPDLSALANQTVGIFSDYSGEGSGNYFTYSFLLCSFGSLAPFQREMKEIRAKYAMGTKEIEFKDFGMGLIRNALPAYLGALNGYVPGLLFTLVVDKRILSLFGPQDRATMKTLAKILDEKGLGQRTPAVAEKLLRVVHTAAYLVGLLGHEGQKIFWMTDHDDICANGEMHNRLLAAFQNVLGLYSARNYGLIGGARPFDERSTDYLDLLSAADIAAGSVEQYFTSRDSLGAQDARVKEGAEKVLQWLGQDGLGLKKLCVMISRGEDGTIMSGSVDFVSKEAPAGITFVPLELCR